MDIAASTYCPFCPDLANILACMTPVLQNNPKGLTSRFYLLRSLFDFILVKHLPEHSVPTSVIFILKFLQAQFLPLYNALSTNPFFITIIQLTISNRKRFIFFLVLRMKHEIIVGLIKTSNAFHFLFVSTKHKTNHQKHIIFYLYKIIFHLIITTKVFPEQ